MRKIYHILVLSPTRIVHEILLGGCQLTAASYYCGIQLLFDRQQWIADGVK